MFPIGFKNALKIWGVSVEIILRFVGFVVVFNTAKKCLRKLQKGLVPPPSALVPKISAICHIQMPDDLKEVECYLELW